MLPPRDYPEQQSRSVAQAGSESESVTVRSVLDRMDSAQPVTDDMIRTAVTNLFTADSHENVKTRVNSPSPKTLSKLLKNVLRD